MLELLIELLGEFLLQVFGEVLVEFGLQALAEPFRRRPSPWLAAAGYGIFGALLGGASLLVLPKHLVAHSGWRVVNLVVTPVAVGVCMAWLGSWRARRGPSLIPIDRFAYAYLFALPFALVRFRWNV